MSACFIEVLAMPPARVSGLHSSSVLRKGPFDHVCVGVLRLHSKLRDLEGSLFHTYLATFRTEIVFTTQSRTH
ncbi:hypothetical protein B0H66DRAFT_547228, partial [Apodospora peruviana]